MYVMRDISVGMFRFKDVEEREIDKSMGNVERVHVPNERPMKKESPLTLMGSRRSFSKDGME